MNIKNIAILLILISAVTFYLMRPGDEKIIKRNLNTLAEYCSSPEQEPALAALQNTMLAGKLCKYPCRVKVESFKVDRDFNKKDFTDHIIMLKKQTTGTHFSFHDTVITFPLDNRAELTSTLRLDGITKNNRFTDAYELNIIAEKTEGEWLFSSFSVIEFME